MKRRISIVIAAVLMASVMLCASGCNLIFRIAERIVVSSMTESEETEEAATPAVNLHEGHTEGNTFSTTVKLDGEKQTLTTKHADLCYHMIKIDYYSNYFEELSDTIAWHELEGDGYITTGMEFEYLPGESSDSYSERAGYYLEFFENVELEKRTIGGIDCFGYVCSEPYAGTNVTNHTTTNFYYFIDLPYGLVTLKMYCTADTKDEALPLMEAMLDTVEFDLERNPHI